MCLAKKRKRKLSFEELVDEEFGSEVRGFLSELEAVADDPVAVLNLLSTVKESLLGLHAVLREYSVRLSRVDPEFATYHLDVSSIDELVKPLRMLLGAFRQKLPESPF